MNEAGLVLAIFPVLIQSIDLYIAGADKLKAGRHYKREFRSLHRALSVQELKFQNTYSDLVHRMETADLLTTEEAHRLLDVEDTGWNGRDLQQLLCQSLQRPVAETFTKTVETILEKLHELQKIVVEPDDSSGMDSNILLSMKRGTKLAFRKDNYKSLIEDLRRLNEELTCLSMMLTPTKAAAKKPERNYATEYNRLRSYARSLYGVLQQGFNLSECECRSHNANLRLRTIAAALTGNNGQRMVVYFDVDTTSNSPEEWRALDFEPVAKTEAAEGEEKRCESDTESNRSESPCRPPASKPEGIIRRTMRNIRGKKSVAFALPEPETNTQTSIANPVKQNLIQNLCAIIRRSTLPTTCTKSCLGVLADDTNGWLHSIFPSLEFTQDTNSYHSETIPLSKLLIPKLLTLGQRLELGVQLAESMMALHDTEWLSHNWGKNDIYFMQKSLRGLLEGQSVSIHQPVMNVPLVRQRFDPTTGRDDEVRSESQTQIVQCNKNLLSLGIVLVELWFERRIEELRGEDAHFGIDDDANFKTAQNLLGHISTHAGINYGNAVHHCINGLKDSVETPAAERSLEYNKFKNDAYENVVNLLQKNLEVLSMLQLAYLPLLTSSI
ncbi:hypothetical protein K440DRAFT_660790 [Wilcoxina mikolae CBS 423.85]|nr:hypothetical protein K440DRAFT_660790 [Wilcoxina mikolae CBS 423.85]